MAKRKNDVRAASHGDPPRARINAQFLACQRVERGVGRGQQTRRQRASLIFRQSLGLVDQRQLFRFFRRRRGQLLAFDVELALVQFARALYGQPFPHGHGPGAGKQTREAGDQQHTLGHGRAGHAHHEAQIGDEPIIRAQDSRTKCIPANRAMAPLVARDHGAFDAVTTTRDRTEQPPVQPLLSRHRAIA
jgi:hypothetical protein